MVDPSLPSDRAAIEFDVVVLGSLNVDLVARTPRLPRPGETVIGSSFTQVAGGKGLNQAVAASRAGASVALVGAVGDDDAGVFLRQVVRAEGIDDRWLETVPGVPTGRALITVDDDAENVIVVVPGANAWEDDALGDDSPLPYGRVTLAQLEVPQSAVARGFASARAIGSITVLNPAPAAQLMPALVARCDLVVPNEHELELLGGAEEVERLGIERLIVTEGSNGVTWFTHGTTHHHDAFVVTPVDTTGAGDAFCGNLCAEVAAGLPLDEAIRYATAAGALATTTAGAVPSLPHRHDVDEYLRRA